MLQKKKQRKDPQERRNEQAEIYEQKVNEWLQSDVIKDFSSFTSCVGEKVKQIKDWKFHCDESAVVLYKCNFENIPQITASVKIKNDMTCQVCVNQNIISMHDLCGLLSRNLKLAHWSQLNNILHCYENPVDKSSIPSVKYLVSLIGEKLYLLLELISGLD